MSASVKKPLDAVALRYQAGKDAAPKVTAKGSGLVAERILELARQHHVPIRQDKNLVQVLSLLDLNQDIDSLSNFKRNTPEFLRQLKESGIESLYEGWIVPHDQPKFLLCFLPNCHKVIPYFLWYRVFLFITSP